MRMFAGCWDGFKIGGTTPRCSGDEAWYAPKHETQNILGGARRRQVNPDHRLHLDNAGGDFDEP